jgi:acetyltransferase-like isoleucine patch superfamily enzyme
MTKINELLSAISLYLYNVLFSKIPINFIRIAFAKRHLSLGKHSFISINVRLLNSENGEKQITIGDHCFINPGCLLDGRFGKIVIGNNVDIARESWIFTLDHDPHDDYHRLRSGDVYIEDYVWIASRVTILPGITIGRGSVIATGAVVTKNIPPMSIAGGVPAAIIGTRKSALKYNITFRPYLYS